MTFSILATICSALVLIFTLLSNNQKEQDSKKTQEDLKKSVDDVSGDLKESLSKTSKIVSEINDLGKNLIDVKDSLNNSLTEAKKFQSLVNEQVRIEKEKFNTDSGFLVNYSESVEFVKNVSDSTKYFFKNTLINKGNRNVILKKYEHLLLLLDSDISIKEKFLSRSEEKMSLIAPNDFFFIQSDAILDIDFLKNTDYDFVYIIRYTYQDEILKIEKSDTRYFRWFGYSSNGLKFNFLDNTSLKKFEEYFNNIFK